VHKADIVMRADMSKPTNDHMPSVAAMLGMRGVSVAMSPLFYLVG
jgi:hypothetical protein